jgi:hypothetical protein
MLTTYINGSITCVAWTGRVEKYDDDEIILNLGRVKKAKKFLIWDYDGN